MKDGANPGDGYIKISYKENTFSYSSKGPQFFIVPDKVYSITVDVIGAAGGNGTNAQVVVGPGGFGARVRSTLAVTPGQKLVIVVGGKGQSAYKNGSWHYGAGGYNGGGSGGCYYSCGGGGGMTVDTFRPLHLNYYPISFRWCH